MPSGGVGSGPSTGAIAASAGAGAGGGGTTSPAVAATGAAGGGGGGKGLPGIPGSADAGAADHMNAAISTAAPTDTAVASMSNLTDVPFRTLTRNRSTGCFSLAAKIVTPVPDVTKR